MLSGVIIIVFGRLLLIAAGLVQLLVITDLIINWTGIVLTDTRYSRLYFRALNFLYQPLKRYLPVYLGGLDFSPMVAFAGLWLVKQFVAYPLIEYGNWLAR